jgi:phosphatidate cytidylyltransferase
VLRARLVTAAVAIPLLLAVILQGPAWLWALVVGVIATIGIGEFAAMAFPARRGERILTIVLGALVILAGVSQRQPNGVATAALAAVVIVGLAWTLLARPDFEQGLGDFGFSAAGILYVSLLAPHFVWLRNVGADGPGWVVFVLAIGMGGDTGGYFVGHRFGRHKLMPRVSPGKTVEGAIGIVVASLVAGAAAKLVPQLLGFAFLRQTSWIEVLLLSGAMAVLGQLGDLSESILKRTFGVKESGWLFPGHGGVLDRLDSLLFPVAVLYYHVSVFR